MARLLNENNLGYTNTLKRLIKESKTDIVCILDPDDTIHPNCCEEFLKEYSKDNRGFVYSNFLYCDEKLKIIKNKISGKISKLPVTESQPIAGGNAPAAPPITILYFVLGFSQIV